MLYSRCRHDSTRYPVHNDVERLFTVPPHVILSANLSAVSLPDSMPNIYLYTQIHAYIIAFDALFYTYTSKYTYLDHNPVFVRGRQSDRLFGNRQSICLRNLRGSENNNTLYFWFAAWLTFVHSLGP